MVEDFRDHFSSVAAQYAEFRPTYPVELFEWLAKLAPGRRRAWDCATGNGQSATGLAEFFEEVIATDASAEQVANAAGHPRVRYVVAQAERCGIESACVDLVTVAQAAHWFDLERFFVESRRVLRPRGVLAIWCYGVINFADPTIDSLVDDFYRNILGPYWPPERSLVEEGYRTLPFPFEEISASPIFMKAEFTLKRFLGYLRTWSATQRFVKANGFDPVEKLGAKLGELWSKGEEPEICWPIAIRIGRQAEG